MSSKKSDETSLFHPLAADDEDQVPNEIESLCVNCEENGVTRMLLTKIPHYKEVILISFHCDHCGYHNNELQSGGQCQEQGIRYVFKVENPAIDLNRQVVKSEYAGVKIPEIELEIPCATQTGEITTIEGIISRVYDQLKQNQEERRRFQSTQAAQIDTFLEKLEALKTGKFTLILDDPSGNSFIENLNPTQADPQITIIHYHRNLQQNKMLCLVADDVEEAIEPPDWESKDALMNEVLHFGTNCPNCQQPAQTNMKLVNVPHFKEVVIMATNCDFCGNRTNEVKSGAGISEKGSRMILQVRKPDDMSRDVLKSETCSIEIPELELSMGMGAISGKFTTVEGLFDSMKNQLQEQSEFFFGDSSAGSHKEAMVKLLAKFDEIMANKMPVTLILDDPAGNSYIQVLGDQDSRLNIEFYERSWQQNDDLGLNDMKTD